MISPKEQPLVSVVLATFNGARFLDEQLKSIQAQTYSNLEIIIWDDGSTDATRDILRKAASHDSRIRLHENTQRLGVISNFLQATQEATGEYVCFSDQDDIWNLNKISRLLTLFDSDPKVMLACSDLAVCDEHGHVITHSFWKHVSTYPLRGKIDECVFLKNFAPGCSLMVRRAVTDPMRGILNAPFMHDHLALIISGALGKIRFIDEPLVQYRQHAANVIGSQGGSLFQKKDFLEQLLLRIDFFETRFPHLSGYDLMKLRQFCRRFAQDDRWLGNWQDIKFFQAIHPDGLKYRLLGAVKCIFPRLIQWFKANTNGEKAA